MAYKDYKKLQPTNNYDHEVAEEYAEAVNEMRELEARQRTLEVLLRENSEVSRFIWTTAEGTAIAIHKIEDDHLMNIMTYLLANSRDMPKEIVAEATSRGMTIPTNRAKLLSVPTMFGRTPVWDYDEGDDDDDDDPWE